MQALAELSDQLGNPGAQKLFLEARRRKIPVTRAQVQNLVKRQGQRQLFQPVQPSRGKSAAEGYSARYQADLADMSTTPSKGFRYFLFLVNVFSREAWAAPLHSKEAVVVAQALRELLEGLPEPPQVIATDEGVEFGGAAGRLLQSRNIAHKTHVGKQDINALGVLDRALQNVKARLARIMARDDAKEWADVLQPAVAGYNKTYNSAIHESPEELLESKEATFMVMQDNARKLEHNKQLTDRRVSKLRSAGAFRRPVGAQHFKRGFRATYGDVEEPTAIRGSTVEGPGGPVNIKLVQIVDKESTRPTPKFAVRGAAKKAEPQGTLDPWLGPGGSARTLMADEHRASLLAFLDRSRGHAAP